MKSILYILLAGLGMMGCRTAEQLTHKGLAKDKAKVIAIVRALSPCITTDSSLEEEIIPAFDSSEIYKAIADSLYQVKRNYKDSIAIRYKDSCRSVKDNYDNGFNLGYEVGKYEGLQDCSPDTLRITTRYNIKDMGEVDICNALKDEAEKKARHYKRMAKFFGGLTAFFALLCFFLYKSRR